MEPTPRPRPALSLLLAIALLLPLAGSPARAAEPVVTNLTPKFVAGRAARYEIWSLRKQVSTMSIQGQSKTTESVHETRGEVSWKIDRINADGSATCTMTFEWLASTTKETGEDEESIDTRKAGNGSIMYEMLKAIAGVPLTVEMAADGSVKTVKGVDGVRGKFSQAVRRTVTEAVRADAIIGRAPDELDFIESATDLAVLAAAQDGLTVNRNWKGTADWNHEMGKLHHDTTHTLSSVEEVAGIPIATVTSTSKLRLDIDKAKLPDLEGIKVETKLKSGEVNSQVMFDLSRREAVGRNSTQSTSIEVRLTREGQVLTHLTDETVQSQALRIAEK